MKHINIMPPEDVEKMFARMGELKLDVSGIKRKFLGCSYGKDPQQKLDIYLPNEGSGPFPVVIYIHGGGWTGGRRDDVQVVPFIGGVDRGFAVVSLDYRLLPNVRYPDNLLDIKSATRWLARNSDTYLLDTSRTALCGSSAGAHLAMLAAFTQGQPVFDGVYGAPDCCVLAVVEQFGPTDLTKIHVHYDESGYPRSFIPGEPSSLDELMGAKAEEIPNLLCFVSPLNYVHRNIPPVLIQHGRFDPIIPYQQGVELYEKINAVAGEGMAELDLSETFLHADPGYAGKESVERIFGFIGKHLLQRR